MYQFIVGAGLGIPSGWLPIIEQQNPPLFNGALRSANAPYVGITIGVGDVTFRALKRNYKRNDVR
jgi:hypothetical protein